MGIRRLQESAGENIQELLIWHRLNLSLALSWEVICCCYRRFRRKVMQQPHGVGVVRCWSHGVELNREMESVKRET